MSAVSIILLPAEPSGQLRAVDVRALACSTALARLLGRAGRAAQWRRLVGSEVAAGLPDCLQPRTPDPAERWQPAVDEQIVLVYGAAYYSPETALRASGLAAVGPIEERRSPGQSGRPSDETDTTGESSDIRLVQCPVQPIRWLDDPDNAVDPRPDAPGTPQGETVSDRSGLTAASLRGMPLGDLCDTFGEANLAWWCVSRSTSHLLSLNTAQLRAASFTNPLYGVQYAQVRIGSVLRESKRRQWPVPAGAEHQACLQAPEELRLSDLIGQWPAVIERASRSLEPHRIIGYLRDLSNALHIYYQTNTVLVDEPCLRGARVSLLLATNEVLADGLALFGISTPEIL